MKFNVEGKLHEITMEQDNLMGGADGIDFSNDVLQEWQPYSVSYMVKDESWLDNSDPVLTQEQWDELVSDAKGVVRRGELQNDSYLYIDGAIFREDTITKIKIEDSNEIRIVSCIDIDGQNLASTIMGSVGALKKYDHQNNAYILSADDADWWTEYLRDHQQDICELNKLVNKYGEPVNEILGEEMEGILNDYPEHHAAYQRAFERIRDEIAYEDEDILLVKDKQPKMLDFER